MKAQTILLGVNVAASLPVVLTQQALAEGPGDTASFLRAAAASKSHAVKLVSQKPSSDQSFVVQSKAESIKRALPRSLPVQTLSSARAVESRLAMSDDGVKLRPFVPGRKLPRKAELQASRLAAQMPQLDENRSSGQSSLAGTVEMGYNVPVNDTYNSPGYSNYTSGFGSRDMIARETSRRLKQAGQAVAKFDRKALPRVLPGQRMMSPGQVGLPCAVNNLSTGNGAPSDAEWTEMAKAVGHKADVDAQNEDDELEMMARQLKNDFTAADFQSMPQPAASSAGPPPFPLSLIPEASLKQFIGGKGHGPAPSAGSMNAMGSAPSPMPNRMAAARPTPSYFGSWHSQGAAPAKSNLQPTGFHTYLTAGNSNHSSSAFKQYSPIAYRNSKRQAPKVSTVSARPAAQPLAKPATMAVYGDYHSSL